MVEFVKIIGFLRRLSKDRLLFSCKSRLQKSNVLPLFVYQGDKSNYKCILKI